MQVGIGLLVACSSAPPDPGDEETEVDSSPVPAALGRLRDYEAGLLDPLRADGQPPWSSVAGPDPIAVLPLRDGTRVGLLRGASALVHLQADGQELHRVEAPAGASGWARGQQGSLYVVGERSDVVSRYREGPDGMELEAHWTVEGARSLRDVAVTRSGRLFFADRHRGRISMTSEPVPVEPGDPGGSLASVHIASCPGAIDVEVQDDILIANCMLGHRVELFGLDASGRPDGRGLVLEHDGPSWALAARSASPGLTLAVAGVEDHPLDRSEGSFGFIDSFVFVYDVTADGRGLRAQRRAAVNLSALGVVTPKWLTWTDDDQLVVTGAGSDRLASLDVSIDPPGARVRTVPAGLVGLAGSPEDGLAADPLLDRWVRLEPGSWSTVSIPGLDTRSPQVRVGEALALTTLMAPAGSSQGQASRFTCETCHFEGTVDGRTHYTGRGVVHATTKTLRGLIGNRPHFSRALDRTSADMVHNEFRVANAGTEQDPWFTTRTADVPWLSLLTTEEALGPEAQRRSLLAFLAAYTPEPNPAVRGRTRFDERERAGSTLFAELCESCHRALVRSDAPDSRIDATRWEAAILSSQTVVWGSVQRALVGVEPLVHPDGPRVPSLRRLSVKRPYFTNGSAPDLEAVLRAVDLGPPFRHAPGGTHPLSPQQRESLQAFIELL